jgi:hypothetical protein
MRKERDELVHIGRAFRASPVEAFLATPRARAAIAGKPLSATRYAKAVVAMANHDVIAGHVVADLPFGIEGAFHPLAAQRRRVAPELHQRLKEVLDAIVADPSKAAAAFAPRLTELSAELVAIPRFRIEHGELRVEQTLLPTRPAAALDYGLALLMEGMPDLGRLCRCALPSCRKFFFASKPRGQKPQGRLRTKFCSGAHMEAAHKADNAERTRRSRERKKEAATKAGSKQK